jgi:hypothetical protein
MATYVTCSGRPLTAHRLTALGLPRQVWDLKLRGNVVAEVPWRGKFQTSGLVSLTHTFICLFMLKCPSPECREAISAALLELEVWARPMAAPIGSK